MAVICPTILANDAQDYARQMDRIAGFAERIQIDLSDGIFAPPHTVNLVQSWWPKDIQADLHLMYQRPGEHLETLVGLKPSLVILHAEADGDLMAIIDHLHICGLKVGLALLPETLPESVKELIEKVDHVLIFSGNLGHFGGVANVKLLEKVAEIRAIHSDIEIGWDGGVSVENVVQLHQGGIDVLNVGSAIQRSDDPETAYATLVAKL